jgi:uncharacterized protein (DUF433 family)
VVWNVGIKNIFRWKAKVVTGEKAGEVFSHRWTQMDTDKNDTEMTNNELDRAGCSMLQYDPKKLGGAPPISAWRITPSTIIENFDDMTIEDLRERFETAVEHFACLGKLANITGDGIGKCSARGKARSRFGAI